MIEWKEQKFNELNTKELYEIFKLRCEVFVVEQEILYNDFDDKDYKAIHLSGFKGGELIAYGRIFEKGDYYPNNPGFGRVAVAEKERGNNHGKELVKKCIEVCERSFEEKEIKISAQAYLEKFYLDLGFELRGKRYIEDGIFHRAMYYNKKKATL
ncbi:GNAT family N-acetyltransferase [Flavobacteriaceae bacterium]|jgi:ElaA protein|nr:GNAT family N-acetyltransferase [Flavobacteriaceae bacterium]MDC1010542.1 GNAT family N-acetyltransferase [Flavobacteriaceae bacterium]